MIKRLVWIFPVLSGIFWGSVGVFVRYLKEYEMNSFAIVESRVLVAIVILAVWMYFRDKKLFYVRIRDAWIFAGASILGMLGVNLAYNEAINRISLSLAAVLLSLSPIYVVILAAILFGEKVTKKKVICGALALIGCVLVSGIFEQTAGIKLDLFGLLLGTIAGFCYALYSLFSKKAMEKGYDGATATFYCLIVIAMILLPFTDWEMIWTFAAAAPIKHSLFFIVHALVSSVLPYVLYTIAIQHMEAGKASILAAGEPVAAMVFGALLFNETPTVLALIGLALTLTALTILSLPERKNTKR